jgi:hypothetical protein
MLGTVAAVVIATLALLSAIAATVAWFYRRGQGEQTLSSSVDRNSEATELLAAQVGGLRDTLEAHGTTLTEHHWRLKALEGSK